jgi:hypothetical protein
MSIVMETISTVEDQVVDAVKSIQEPVADYVRTVTEYIGSVVPSDLPSLPFADQVPTATEVIEQQFDFAKRLLEANHQLVTAIVTAAKPAA